MDLEEEIKCKICFLFENPVSNINDLISPCQCKGTMKYVHKECLKMWRFKGKSYSDIKRCIQCGENYNLKDELTLNIYLIRMLTLLLIVFLYYLNAFFIKSLLESGFIIAKNIIFGDINMLYGSIDNVGIFINRTLLKEYINIFYINIHYFYVFVFITMYKLLVFNTYFSLFNYVFTFWRLTQFNFFIDRILFIGMSIFYSNKLYNSMFYKIDTLIIYFLNSR